MQNSKNEGCKTICQIQYMKLILFIWVSLVKEDEEHLNNNYLELVDEIINYFKLDKKVRPKYLKYFI